MPRKLMRCCLRRGPNWSRPIATVLCGAVWGLLGLVGAPGQVAAQQYYYDSQQPAWQQRPGVQQARYTSAASGQVQASQRYAASTGQTPLLQESSSRVAMRPRVRPVAQEMETPVATEAAPEEIYPEAAPANGGEYVEGGAPMEYAGGGPGCDSCYGGGCGSCYGGGACDAPLWGPGEFFGCGPWLEPDRLWVRSESLLWWTKGVEVPALVTTSPLGTAQSVAGRLGESTTSILFGNQDISGDSRGGGRITFGLRPTECTPWGVEASYFQLGGGTTRFHQASNGNLILARPFYSLESSFGSSEARLVDFSGVSSDGSVDIEAKSQLRNVEVLFRRRLAETCTGHLDLLAGWRYDRLNDHLLISDSFTEVSSGNDIAETDYFRTDNVFNGGELGIVAESQWCRWSFEGLLKVAFGNTRSEVELVGTTTTTDPGVSSNTAGYGLLVLPSNAGLQQRSQFGMIPELGMTVGYDLTCRLRATVGYSLIYWGKVARAGDQIDMDLNRGQLTSSQGLGRPNQPFVTNDFWAQGVNAGLEFHF